MAETADSAAGSDGRAGRQLHIVLFPWLAFGHMIPYLELSVLLANRGHKVSFLSTPRNIDRLQSKLQDAALSPGHLNLIKLPRFPKVDGLVPDDAEATSDLPPSRVQYLKKAFDDHLPRAISEFLQQSRNEGHPVDWIFHDFAPHWLPPLASKAGVRKAYFSILTASTMAFFGPPSELEPATMTRSKPEHFLVPPSWIRFPSEAAFRLHEAKSVFSGAFESVGVTGVTDSQRVRAIFSSCDAVLVRSCEEYEAKYLDLLPSLYQKRVLPVGVLPPPPVDDQLRAINDHQERQLPLFSWLDGQKPRSVVYVALGSEATLSLEMIHELALGLELSGLPFLWALRRPIDLSPDTEILPPGFEDRTKGSGLVCMGWVPQDRVLRHGSVGGFLNHSGWSSTVEALHHGIPLALLTIFVDQGLVARRIVAEGPALEVERDEGDGSFTREAVAKALKELMVGTQAEAYRARAAELQKELFANRDIQDRCLDNLIAFLAS